MGKWRQLTYEDNALALRYVAQGLREKAALEQEHAEWHERLAIYYELRGSGQNAASREFSSGLREAFEKHMDKWQEWQRAYGVKSIASKFEIAESTLATQLRRIFGFSYPSEVKKIEARNARAAARRADSERVLKELGAKP